MSERIDSVLVSNAFRMVLQQRRPGPELLFHSDRGVQYAADAYQELLGRSEVLCRMSPHMSRPFFVEHSTYHGSRV